MEAGHSGMSGRFKRHRDTALIYAFLLDLAGIKE
jgi:oligopeptidase B